MKNNRLFLIFLVLIIISGGIIGYFVYENYLLKEYKLVLEKEVTQTSSNFISTIKKLNTTIKDLELVIASTQEELLRTKAEYDNLIVKYNLEKDRMDAFSSQIGNIQGKVGVLEKLSQTDPELLKKYSKVYFLNENYVPATFIKIDTAYTYNPKTDYLIYSQIWPFLKDLITAAEVEKIDIEVISAYRSFGLQSVIKSSHLIIFGSGANKFSADQGYSEHQLGTTVDFTTSEIGATYLGFEKTPTYQWLLDNAYKYGFILSYPEGNQYYQYEPWHWRFVGRALAQKLHQEGRYFYDLDQRVIDQYLISFFD